MTIDGEGCRDCWKALYNRTPSLKVSACTNHTLDTLDTLDTTQKMTHEEQTLGMVECKVKEVKGLLEGVVRSNSKFDRIINIEKETSCL